MNELVSWPLFGTPGGMPVDSNAPVPVRPKAAHAGAKPGPRAKHLRRTSEQIRKSRISPAHATIVLADKPNPTGDR